MTSRFYTLPYMEGQGEMEYGIMTDSKYKVNILFLFLHHKADHLTLQALTSLPVMAWACHPYCKDFLLLHKKTQVSP